MNTLLKIDNIMYRVSDLEKAEKFYGDVLELKKVWEDKDAKMIGFVLQDSDSEIVITNDPSMPEFTYSYLVDDVVSMCEGYRKQGYEVKEEPT